VECAGGAVGLVDAWLMFLLNLLKYAILFLFVFRVSSIQFKIMSGGKRVQLKTAGLRFA
jgi:hypothetical protein